VQCVKLYPATLKLRDLIPEIAYKIAAAGGPLVGKCNKELVQLITGRRRLAQCGIRRRRLGRKPNHYDAILGRKGLRSSLTLCRRRLLDERVEKIPLGQDAFVVDVAPINDLVSHAALDLRLSNIFICCSCGFFFSWRIFGRQKVQ